MSVLPVVMVTPALPESAIRRWGDEEILEQIVVWDTKCQRYTRTVNRGIRIALQRARADVYDKELEYILLANDDCQPQTANWIAELIWAMAQNESLGYVAPGQPCRTEGMMEATGPTETPQIKEIFAVPFGCVLIRRSVFRDVGLLDERFRHYASDTDHQYRARAFGWKSAWCPHVWVDREAHAPKLMDLWQEDRKLFYGRWGNE